MTVMEVEMILVSSNEDEHEYREMIDVVTGDRKLERPIYIQRCGFEGDAPEIITIRVEIKPKFLPLSVA